MILTIISIVLVFIGVILCIIDANSNRKIYEASILVDIGVPSFATGIIGIIFCVGFILGSHSPRIVEKNHQKLLNQKYVIEERLRTSDDAMVVQDWLYDDVLEFNNKLYNTKKNLDNPWINWFESAKEIEGIDYIQYGDINWEG